MVEVRAWWRCAHAIRSILVELFELIVFFYVDDNLISVPTMKEAIICAKGIIECLQRGGFKLTQFTSNSRELLVAIPSDRRSKNFNKTDFKLDTDPWPTERTLGMIWDTESDCSKYAVTIKPESTSRKGVLSVVHSIYDPLGLISLVLME